MTKLNSENQMDKYKRIILNILKWAGIALLVLIIGIISLFIIYGRNLPRPEAFTQSYLPQSTKIYDRTGTVLLYQIYGEQKRTLVPLSSIPLQLQEAVIATEDADFYHHFGIDPKRMLVSFFEDIKTGSLAYGASTIDQQLIRSTFLSNDKTATRKIREIILALELDHQYSKSQILGWYLNQVPFGQNTYGVEAASETYFKEPVSSLSLAQDAILAALIRGPSYYSPYGPNKDALLARKNYVLDRMVANHYITQAQADAAKNETIAFQDVLNPIKAPGFTLWVTNYLENTYSQDYLQNGGLKVYTSLDWNMQQNMEQIVEKAAQVNKAYNANDAAMVALDPKTGEILAMVGSANWYATSSYPAGCSSAQNTCLFDPKVNVAVGAAGSPGRQPGSSFKPFVYVTAFEDGYNDSTVVSDIPTDFGVWGGKDYIPQDYDKKFRGDVTLRQALAESLNIPSVKVLYLVGGGSPQDAITTTNFTGQETIFNQGVADSIQTAQKMGITTLNGPLSSYGPSIVLGGGEVNLLDMVSAYGVFATEGLHIPPVSILKITDSQGNIIEQNNTTPERVLPVEPTRIINSILSDNNARAPMFGYNSALYLPGYQVAVKTGTTQNYNDGWTIGYTPSIVVGAWVGNNNNAPMAAEPGVVVAGPMWHNFMASVLPQLPKESFTPPQENSPATGVSTTSSSNVLATPSPATTTASIDSF